MSEHQKRVAIVVRFLMTRAARGRPPGHSDFRLLHSRREYLKNYRQEAEELLKLLTL